MTGAPPTPRPSTFSRNVAFSMLSAGSGVLLLPLLFLAASRLGDAAFGRFSWALALTVIFETLMDYGLKEVTTRAVARSPGVASVYLRNTYGIKLVLSGGSLVLLTAVALVLKPEAEVRWAVVALGVAAILRSYMTTIRSVFYGLDRFNLETAVLICDRALVLGFGAAALLAGYGVVGLAVAFVAGRIVAFLVADALMTRTIGRAGPAFDVAFWRDLRTQALPLGTFVVVLQIYNYVDIVMLGTMRSDAETGLYSAAYRAYEAFGHVPSIIALVLAPRLAREFVVRPTAHRRTARLGIAGAALLGFPAALAAWFAAAPLIALIYLNQYQASTAVFQILAAGFVVMFPLAVLHVVAVSINAERILLRTAVIGCVVNVVANAVLIPAYGMHGAAAATVLGEAVSLAILGRALWPYVRRSTAQTSGANGV